MTDNVISHYRLLGKLGGGGMGLVYKAEDTTLHRLVALKFLVVGTDTRSGPAGGIEPGTPRPSGSSSQDPQALGRFQREARAAAALNHPNICTIYEIGEHQGQIFIAMELVEGQTLAQKLKAGPLGMEEAALIARQVAEGLEEAHEHRIIHRDLKPANVMVTPKGRAKILDFGLAKQVAPTDPGAATQESLLHSQAGAVVGTVPYMSPEQLRGDAVDARSDLYSFGTLLYEMVTGRRPFPGTQTTQLIAAILTAPPSPPRGLNAEIPPEFEAVILKALAKEPADRYQTAREMLADLPVPARSLSGSRWGETSGFARPASAPAAAPARRAGRRTAVWIGAAVVLAALAGALFYLIPALRRHVVKQPGAAQATPSSGKQLAVLPFSVIGGGANEQAFSRGLEETLTAKLTELSTGEALQVVPVGDLLAQHINTARDAARVFRVNLVLTGSLMRAGNQMRVTYALVDPTTERQLRAATLTLPASNPFGIEDKVVEGTADMLGLPIRPAQRQEVESHGTAAASAFKDYLQGLGYLQNYDNRENLNKAVDSFQAALKGDSTYALAYAGLGQTYWKIYQQTRDTAWVDKAQQSCSQAVTLNAQLPASHLCLGILENGTGQYAKAIAEFQKVLAVEPTNTEAYGGLGTAQIHLKKMAAAEATYRRAISLRPNYWAPYNWLAILYFESGKVRDSAAMFKKVTELAPGNHMGYYNLGATYFMLGKWRQAEQMYRKSIALAPSPTAYSNLGTAIFYEGHYRESAEYFKQALKFTPKDPQLWGNLADAYKWSGNEVAKAVPTYRKAAELVRTGLSVNPHSYALLGELAMYEAQSGDFHAALRDAQRALALAPQDPEFYYNISIAFRVAGHPAKALGYLQQAVKLGYPVLALRADPEWKGLSNNPAFQKLLASNTH